MASSMVFPNSQLTLLITCEHFCPRIPAKIFLNVIKTKASQTSKLTCKYERVKTHGLFLLNSEIKSCKKKGQFF